MIYVVTASASDYEYYDHWIIKAFESEQEAEMFAKDANEQFEEYRVWYREAHEKLQRQISNARGKMDFDDYLIEMESLENKFQEDAAKIVSYDPEFEYRETHYHPEYFGCYEVEEVFYERA